MKKILFILFFLISIAGFGQTTYYIDPTGDDGTGTGAIGAPWKTLDKAAETVRTSGDIIHVNAGTYTEIDTIGLADGVSIIGEGPTSIITTAISTAALIQLRGAAEGEDGSQSISYLYFDGNDTTAYAAISVYARSNVEVHHCTFVDWLNWAILFAGRVDHTDGAPTTYAEGNSFHHNTVSNSSRYTSYGTGQLNLAGQKDMLIYNNNMSQFGRPRSTSNKQTEGFIIKAAYPSNGHNMGVKIYNNTLTTHANSNLWRFAIETFGVHGGFEIYDNTIKGTVDFGNPPTGNAIDDVGSYGYAAKIYDNLLENDIPQDSLAKKIFGVDLEGSIDGGVYVYSNKITNCATGVVFSQTAGKTVDSVFIYNNVINGVGLTTTANYGSGISIGSNNSSVFTNIRVYNNSIYANTLGLSPQYGIFINFGTGLNSDLIIRNNILKGFNKITDTSRGIRVQGSTIDNVNIDNNLLYDNKGTNEIDKVSNTLTDTTENNNLLGYDPLFISTTNLRLQSGSPAINAGYATGLTTDAEGNTRDSQVDIGAFEYQTLPVPVTGLGWEDHLAKRNFKDDINFAGRWMIDAIPVTATAAELNALVGQGQIISGLDTIHLSNRINTKADTSLSNLASVAINTHLLPGTDGAVNLGSATYKWGNIFMDSAKVVSWNNGDITETHSDQTLTFAGGNIVLPSTTSIGDVSAAELAHVNTVSSNIQTQLNNKADTAGAIDIGDVTHLLTDTLELHTFNAGYNVAGDTIFFGAGSIFSPYHTRGRDTTVVTHVISQISDGDSLTFHILYADTINAVVPTHVTDTIVLNNNGTVETTLFNCDTIPPNKWVYAKVIATPDNKNPVFFASTMVGHKVKGTSVDPLGVIANLTDEYRTIYNSFVTKPTGDTIQWQANLIYSLDSAALYNRIKLLYMPVAASSLADSYINWAAVNSTGDYDLTLGNAPVLNRVAGWVGNGTSNYLKTGWIPNSDTLLTNHGGAEPSGVGRNDMTVAAWSLGNTTGNVAPFGVSGSDARRIFPRLNFGDKIECYINSSVNSEFNDPTTSIGFTMVTRNGRLSLTAYKNGAAAGTDNDTSTLLPDDEFYVLAVNADGAGGSFFNSTLSIVLVMDAISEAEALAIYNIFNLYMNRVQ